MDVVTEAMQLDERIGTGALCGAIAYGGPFFDHDNEALAAMLRRLAVAPELVGVLGRFNRAQVPWLTDLIQERAPVGGRVAVLGLSYKPDTDVIVNAIGIELCERLDERGFALVAHDPVAMPEARGALPRSVELAPTPEAAIRAADLVVLTLPWDAYRSLSPDVWARAGDSPRRAALNRSEGGIPYRDHSPVTFSRPRRRNHRDPRASFVIHSSSAGNRWTWALCAPADRAIRPPQ